MLHHFWIGTPIGGGLDGLLASVLLFWPSHDAYDREEEVDMDPFLEGISARWREAMRAAAGEPDCEPLPPHVARPIAPVPFGRRGL